MNRKIPTLSLFSGAGGLDIGLHHAGFEILGCVELEEAYCKTLKANRGRGKEFPDSLKVFCQDVTEFDPTPFKDQCIECIVGGPPCQTFSAAGRRSGGVIGTRDKRGLLFETYCEILGFLDPQVFVFENVYGLPGANGGGPWKEIVRAFGSLGYELFSEVVDAADYGVPQHRERLIMVGVKNGEFTFPMPTHGPDSTGGKPLVSAESAIADLQDAQESYHQGLGGLYGHLLPAVPEGLNYAFFTAEMGHPEPQFAWRSKFHDLLYKVDRTSPCRTIKAQPGKFTGPFHWKNRHFTLDELKRLQSFPDSYELVGSNTRIIEQIGNSVPPKLAEVIGVSLREQVFDSRDILTYVPRPQGFKSTFRKRQRERSKRFKEIAKDAIQKKYGTSFKHTKPDAAHSKERKEVYILRCEGLFKRTTEILTCGAHETALDNQYQVKVTKFGDSIDIRFDSSLAHNKTPKTSINITGLSKYLRAIDTVRVAATLSSPSDIFHMWKVVEDTLTDSSRFYSLIDIYGHYANRGDTVDVTSEVFIPNFPRLERLLNVLMHSSKCGSFVSTNLVQNEAELSFCELIDSISDLRLVRFDIRTNLTHPIIPTGSVLCTYPFPLLSPRALVESRAQFITEPKRPEYEKIILA